MAKTTLEARFWAKVKTEGACWLWQGALAGSLRYGEFRGSSGSPEYAHRVSWQLRYGPIPEGALVLHRCDVPRCVRPDHLYLGNYADNSRDKVDSMRIRRSSQPVVESAPKIISVRVSASLLEKMEAIAAVEHSSRSDVVRVAVELYHAERSLTGVP